MALPADDSDGQAFAATVIRRTFLRSASSRFLVELTADLARSGVLVAVNARNTEAVFGWLMTVLSYQGISDRAANQFIASHGQIGWHDMVAMTTDPACPKLTSYWHFEGCNYRKGAATCARPDLISHCKLPSHALRNGRLNQTAASLYLFIRDVAEGDLIGWLDSLLDQHAAEPAHNRCAALIEPMRNIYGVSDKMASMLLSTLLLGAGRRRRLWFETGTAFVVVDTLVHNYLHRTGILAALSADHLYGQGCYGPTGCAGIIQRAAAEIDARVFGRALPRYFPRFVQHGLWRFCAMDGLDVCNGNRVDDRHRCQNRYCLDYTSCRREKLTAQTAGKTAISRPY
jgi:hypothetical protein